MVNLLNIVSALFYIWAVQVIADPTSDPNVAAEHKIKIPGWKPVVKDNKLSDSPFIQKLEQEVSKVKRKDVTPKASASGNVIDIKFRRDKKESRPKEFSQADFAYHDKMESAGAGDVETFERHLKSYQQKESNLKYSDSLNYLHFGEGEDPTLTRKSANAAMDADPEEDILMHYAVPLDVKIYGYLQVPELN